MTAFIPRPSEHAMRPLWAQNYSRALNALRISRALRVVEGYSYNSQIKLLVNPWQNAAGREIEDGWHILPVVLYIRRADMARTLFRSEISVYNLNSDWETAILLVDNRATFIWPFMQRIVPLGATHFLGIRL